MGGYLHVVNLAAGLLGVLSAFGAGWYWLDNATQGSPGLYVYGGLALVIGGLTGPL